MSSGFSQSIYRLQSVAWTLGSAISAATAVPTTDAHGVAIGPGAMIIQYGVADLTAITGYAIRLWAMDANDDWAIVAEHLNLGSLARVYEASVQGFGDGGRYCVQLVSIAGTSLKLKYRSV